MEWLSSFKASLRLFVVAMLASCFWIVPTDAQGTFRNMDFEQAQVPQTQSAGFVSADLALPFWTVYYGTSPQTEVYWNDVSVGSTQASLLGLFPANPFGGPKALAGGYGAYLFGGPTDCSISQVGQIPTNAASLLFKAQYVDTGRLVVTVGGVSLPVFDVSSGPNYTLYGVNVSQFAGLQEDLRFIAPAGLNSWNLDDIVFSTTPVPEPAMGTLLVFACLLFALRTPLNHRTQRTLRSCRGVFKNQWRGAAGSERYSTEVRNG